MATKKPQRITLDKEELKAFKKRIRERGALCDQDYQFIDAMTDAVEALTQALENKRASVTRLARYLFGAPTETAKNVLPKDEPPPETPPTPRKKSPGHGRNGNRAFTGGRRAKLKHEQLKAGDPCPACPRGTLYELALPATTIHLEGSAPINATIYELERLRCNACGMIFTASAPDDACLQKYADSAIAMVAILKYGCGMPFYRLGKLQKSVGIPLAPSTQWEIVDAGAEIVRPSFEALIDQAAQGKVLHNDDTTMKIISFLRESDPESERKGIFTTGIVSLSDEHRIAVFFTGHHHAGENLEELLRRRAHALQAPIQMCDALSRNAPKTFQTILCNCLTHARRQFIDVMESFPEACSHVIRQLARVYQNDELAKQQAMTPEQRLALHQSQSAPVLEELKQWGEKQLRENLTEPASGLGKAINYLLKHWEKLTRFLTVVGAPIDNNICERALKHAVLHRKNAYHYKTLHGAAVGDLFMSLIHTCELSGENPLDYLTTLLAHGPELRKAPTGWLPWNYRKSLAELDNSS